MKQLIKNGLTIVVLALAFLANAQSSNNWFGENIRRIHMDFHTLEVAPEVAIKSFDAKRYIQTLRDAEVNSLVTFAKGHHGNCYYNTQIGHKHSGLPAETDMLGEIVEEGQKQGMKILAYYSVGWLTPIELNQPEWMERDTLGRKMGTSGSLNETGWNQICLNSPYLEEMVLPELKEITSNYAIDAVWIDIIENNACYCQWCRAKFEEQNGRPYASHEEARLLASDTRYEAVSKMINTVKEIKPEVLISYNTAGRDPRLVPLVDFCSIETHPGATWHQEAWTHSLLTMKYLEQYDKPWESTTSRFIHGWGGWDDQTTENMLAVASRIAAHGGVINLGDQTYPSGELDGEIYRKIGDVFQYIEKMESQSIGATSYPQVGLFATPFDIYAIYGPNPGQLDAYMGAAKALVDRGWHFDLILEGNLPELSQFKAIVLPDVGAISPSSQEALRAYVAQGGKLLVTGNSTFDPQKQTFELADVMGVNFQGMSPYSVGYLDLKEEISDGLRKSLLLTPGKFFEVTPKEGAQSLGDHVYPLIEPKAEELFFFRNAQLSPPGKKSSSAGIVSHRYGEGQVVYAAAPIFRVYLAEDQWYLKGVADNLLKHMDVTRDVEVLDAPQSVEMYLRQKDGNLVINLVNYFLHKETNQVEDEVPLYDLTLRVSKQLVKNDKPKIFGSSTGYTMEETTEDYLITLDQLDMYAQVVFALQ
ncbi:alpha-amylase family protein [Marinoscillum furvescens]|uniref:Beta-galactosidase-like protein n=1 Tax=Marinoscillum furvescens DSM 4134 TaxID=1122208 RepID=A0A3D9L799_MARFU|nr:alpha-amylase family protein [Marinoscillum furvescens]REE01539.1 beta-galactosidase-like protein [Marinoscillum furvescens DSM 4134]